MSYRFSIVGAGAVGGYYGALLAKAGYEVDFLLHRDYGHVLAHGLRIDSSNGNFHLPRVHAYASAEDMPRADVVIVALKTTANHVLPHILPRLVKEDGVVVTLQNGLGSEQAIGNILGSAATILGGLCFLCSNKIGPGHIDHLDYGLITLGEYGHDGTPKGVTARLQAVGEMLAHADIPIQLVDDLYHARWKKLVWNIPFNGLSVTRNELTDALVGNPTTRELCLAIMHEVATAAEACSRPIPNDFIATMLRDTERMKPYAPSMKLDYERGNPMELESIYFNPIQAAKTKGIDMPETERLYQTLKAMDHRVGTTTL